MARRSVLFAPGDQPEKLRKALRVGADVVVFDLEDGVAPDSRERARTAVADVLREIARGDRPADPAVCVRVNPAGEGADADLDAVLEGRTAAGPPDALMVPKADGAAAVEAVAGAARAVLQRPDGPGDHEPGDAGPFPVLALVESAAGVLAADAIAAAAPTDALVFGAEDLAGDVGAERTPRGEEVLYARQRVLLAARAAGVDAIDTHVPAFDDAERLRADAERARGYGYDGKLALHPSQVPVIHEAFAPPPDRVEWARRVLEASDGEPASGVVVVDGEMVDAPQIRQARRILARAGESSDG